MNEQIGNKINDKTYIKLTPFKGFVLENFPFIEADFDAITNYQLLCKVIEYLNNVIANQNTVQELASELVGYYNALVDAVNLAINEFETDVTADINQFKIDVNEDFEEFTSDITTQFNNLQNYVNNYFDNNFPELVSNKLDEMAENGTLENLLNDVAHLTKSYNTYTDLIADSENFTNGLRLKTLGYYEINDGGSAEYIVSNNNQGIVISELENSLYVKLVSNIPNIKQFGAKGNGTDNDSPIIQKAITALSGKTLYIPSGTYIIDDPLIISSSNTSLIGTGLETPIFKKTSSTATNRQISYNGTTFDYNSYPSIFNLIFPEDNNITHINIENLRLELNTNKTLNGIIAPHCTNSIFKNIRITNANYGILLNGWLNVIEKCSTYNTNFGIYNLYGDNYHNVCNKILNCYVNTGAIRIHGGNNVLISGTQVDNGNPCYDIVNSKSVTMIACSTETYSIPFRNTNSNVYIYGGDFEGHTSSGSTFGGFFTNQQNGNTYIKESNIHFEDYASLGNPSDTNLVTNTGGNVEIKANITTPYTYTNYISGTATTKINDLVNSTLKTTMKKLHKTATLGSQVELFRFPFSYGKNIRAKIYGQGIYSHTSVIVDCLITGASILQDNNPTIDRGTFTIKDNTCIATKDTDTITATISGEINLTTKELIIYYNSSTNYPIPLDYYIEYNDIN